MKIAIVLSLFVGLVLTKPSADEQTEKNIVELATELGATTLVDLVTKAQLATALSGTGPFTVFAPSNEAFAALPKEFLDYLEDHIEALQDLLKYHVLAAEVKSTDIKNDETCETLQGAKLRTNIYDDGKIITVDGSKVTTADQMASNGVIHVIDKVLVHIPKRDIVEVATMLPMFSVLVEALEKAELVDVLKGDGPFTVFAPTNNAFEKIPKDELDRILANKELLTNILKYHVVGSTQYSAGLKNGMRVPTLEGKSVTIHIHHDGEVMVNNAKVEVPDFTVTNGVIHIIDTVLVPRAPPK